MPPRRKAALKATSQRSLTSFTTTTKSAQPASAKDAVLKTLTNSANVEAAPPILEEIQLPSTPVKPTPTKPTTRSTPARAAAAKAAPATSVKSTPTKATPVRKAVPAKTPAKTPTKTPSRKRRLSSPSPDSDPAPLLKHFKSLDPTPSRTAPSTPTKAIAPSTPSRARASSPSLPSTFKILIKTHAALLLILPLLNTFSTPISALIPRLSLQTGHRISEELLRKCCYLTEDTCFPVELVDYGKGRICAHFSLEKPSFSMAQAKAEFAEKIKEWEDNVEEEGSVKEEDQTNAKEVEGEVIKKENDVDADREEKKDKKPKKEIPMCEIRQDVVKKSVLGERRRIEVLKGKTTTTTTTTTTIKKEEEESVTSTLTKPVAPKLKHRQSSLLDRIRAKQEEQKLIVTPSKQELQREMALSRISEIRDILTGLLLSGGAGQKAVGNMVLVNGKLGVSKSVARREKSFSMDEVVERVRESVKLPIGAEEVRIAVGILDEERREVKKGEEKAGRLEVKVVELGKVKGVVLSRG